MDRGEEFTKKKKTYDMFVFEDISKTFYFRVLCTQRITASFYCHRRLDWALLNTVQKTDRGPEAAAAILIMFQRHLVIILESHTCGTKRQSPRHFGEK